MDEKDGEIKHMGVMHELTSGGFMSREFLTTVGTIGGLGATAVNSFVRVPKNHRGIPTFREDPVRRIGSRKGQLRRAVGSGIHPVVPFFGGIRHTTMQKCPEDLPSFSVESEEGKLVGDVGILWHVKQHEEPLPDLPTERRKLSLKGLVKNIRQHHEQRKLKRSLPRKPIAQRLKDSRVAKQEQNVIKGQQAKEKRLQENEDLMDLYRALFLVKDEKLDNFVRMEVGSYISSAVSELGQKEARVPNKVYEHVMENNGETLNEYGLALDAIYIRTLSRSEAQVHGDTLGHLTKPPGGESPGDEGTGGVIISLLPDPS